LSAWIWLGLLSAVFAGLIGVVGKRGLETVDPTLGTAVRAVIMAVVLVLAAVTLGKAKGLREIPRDALLWIVASGLCGAASWICYFWALRLGPAGGVAAIDRLSVVFALLFAALLLGERITPLTGIGGALIAIGALLVARGR
jgi:transporter family protein